MSGQTRSRNSGCVDHWPSIDLRYLKRRGWLRPGQRGNLRWTRGEHLMATARFVVWLGEDPRLDVTLRAEDLERSQTLGLASLPCHYGGVRWMLVCPASGRRCQELFWSNNRGRFVSRQAAKLTDAWASEGSGERRRRAYKNAEARAYGWDGYPTPRGDNRRRLMARAKRLETVYAVSWYGAIKARFGAQFGSEELDYLADL